MPEPSCWRIEGDAAWLEAGSLRARLALALPTPGLSCPHVAGRECPSASLLGISGPWPSEAPPQPPREAYARGDDLIVRFEQPSRAALHVEATWRPLGGEPGSGIIAGVELVLSVHTDLLESRPAARVASVMAAAEVVRLDVEDSPGAGGVSGEVSGEPAGRPAAALFLWRSPDCPFSYAEMAYPSEFHEAETDAPPDRPGALRVVHRLFPEQLEKGVILRARLRGFFVERAGDESVARRCYAALAAMDPPLGAF
jgi:hypothetical protein